MGGFFNDLVKAIAPVAPVIGGIVGGIYGGPAGAAIGVSAGSGLSSWAGQEQANRETHDNMQETNAFSAAQSEINRNFQQENSNSSYQRGIADMQAAGINPLLAYSQGGASTPSGSAASGVTAQAQNSFKGYEQSAAGVADTLMKKQQYDLQSKNADADIGLKKAQTIKTVVDTGIAKSDAVKANISKGLYEAVQPYSEKLIEGAKATAKGYKDAYDYYKSPEYKKNNQRDAENKFKMGLP